MKRIQEDFKLNDDKIEPPDLYLGARPSKMNLYDCKYYWIMSPEQNAKEEVTDLEVDLSRSGKRFPLKISHATLKQICTLARGFDRSDGK